MTESKVQSELIRYLKGKGCYVIKTRPGMGTPLGCPDVFAFFEGFWAAFEIKASPKSAFGPLQEETIKKLSDWSFCCVVHTDNLQEVKQKLETIL